MANFLLIRELCELKKITSYKATQNVASIVEIPSLLAIK